MRILAIIPAYNEENNISGVINDLKSNFQNIDILVINDCSTDSTVENAKKAGAFVVSQPFNMGYASALQTGFKFADRNNFDHILQFDGDGQHLASEAIKLYKIAINENKDVVIGSRYMAKTGYKNSFFRSLGTNFFRILIKTICKKEVYDPTSGLQVLSHKYYSLFAEMNGYTEYPDANLMIELIRSGAEIKEVPVVMKERTDGTSMHSGIVKPIAYMFLMTYSIFIVLLRKKNRYSTGRR